MKPSILFKGSYLLLITEIRNLVPTVQRDWRLVSETQGLGVPLSKVGFPIRKFTDQSFFAAPRDLSQRSTSFIASQRQGIHRMPLRHLIALIINAHPTRQQDEHFFGQSSSSLSEERDDRKTSFASQDRTNSETFSCDLTHPKAHDPETKNPLTMSHRLPPSLLRGNNERRCARMSATASCCGNTGT